MPRWMIKLSILMTVCGLISLSSTIKAETFNLRALEIDNPTLQPVDLTQFSQTNQPTAGTHYLTLYVNKENKGLQPIVFAPNKQGELQPQITPDMLQQWGVNISAFTTLNKMPQNQPIENLDDIIPGIRTSLLFNQLQLDISIPQSALIFQARNSIDPSSWDQGINAFLLNYTLSGNNVLDRQVDASNNSGNNRFYANLQSGINLGAWRIRNYSIYNSGNADSPHFSTISNYMQRDIQSLGSSLTLGDAYSSSDVFSSVSFRGVQLASDDSMLPDSLRGFAPVVQGIAKSNADVTVRQNGYIIYQTSVPAGMFTIRDLYPGSNSGDLVVTITEADGSESTFTQPFSAVPLMQRQGYLKYAVAAGEYRDGGNGSGQNPNFIQASAAYGLPHDLTLYGGLLLAENYHSAAVGGAFTLGNWGSLSLDVTQSRTQLTTGQKADSLGYAYRMQYAKSLTETKTAFSFAATQYSGGGFYTFQEANQLDTGTLSGTPQTFKWQATINQPLDDNWGSLYASIYANYFQNSVMDERNATVSYSNSYERIQYTLSYSLITNNITPQDKQIAFSVYIPLDRWLSNTSVNYSISQGLNSGTSQQVGLYGSTLDNNNLSYSVQESYSSNQSAFNSGISYRAPYGQMNAGYNSSSYANQINYSMQGGLLVHSDGVTLSQHLNDSVVLVHVPDAPGVTLQTGNNIVTDSQGYAVIPYATQYRKNRVAIDTRSLSDTVDITQTTQTAIPTKGAIVKVSFESKVGERAFFTLTHRDELVPFGAIASLVTKQSKTNHSVSDSTQEREINTGIVDEEGAVYLSGLPEQGTIKVQWGNTADQQCQVDFKLPVRTKDNTQMVFRLKETCR